MSSTINSKEAGLRYFKIFLIFSVLTSIAQAGALEEILKAKKLRVGLDAQYMPFEMRSKKGKIIGFDVDIAKQMAKALGVELEIVNTEWDGIIPALLTKKFDILMSGMTITPERNLKVNFAEPYYVVGQSVVIRKDLADKIKSYKDLDDKKYKLGSKLGTTGEIAVKAKLTKATYKAYDNIQEAGLDLLNGRLDAIVFDKPFNAVFVLQKGQDKLVHLDEPFTYEPLAWAVRKGDPDFLNWLNNFLRQVKNDGRYAKLEGHWFKSTDWLGMVQ